MFDIKKFLQEAEEKYPSKVVFVRFGDFYEAFGRSADIAAEVLNLYVRKVSGVSCIGFPVLEMEKFLSSFEKAGYKNEKAALRLIRSLGNATYDIDFELPVYVVFRR